MKHFLECSLATEWGMHTKFKLEECAVVTLIRGMMIFLGFRESKLKQKAAKLSPNQ